MKPLVLTVVALSTIAAGPAPKTPSVALGETNAVAFTQRDPKPMTAGGYPVATPVPAGAGGIIGAIIGGFIVERMAGAKLVKEHELVDPAGEMSRALAYRLADLRQAEVLAQPVLVKREKPKAIAKMSGGARYIVDVRTLSWSLVGMAGDGRKDATYWGELKVIDGVKGAVLVESECKWDAPTLQKPSKAAWEQDPREVTQDHFAVAKDVCLNQFSLAMKSLYTVPPRPIAPSEIAASAPTPARITQSVAPPATVAVAALPPAPSAVSPSARPVAPPPAPSPPPAPRVEAVQRQPVVAAPAAVVMARSEVRQAVRPPVVEEYPYARPYEAPPARAPQPDYRYAGRDANGYLVWPGKRQ